MNTRNGKIIQYGRASKKQKERRQSETVEEHRNKRRKLIDDDEEEEPPGPQRNFGRTSLQPLGGLAPTSPPSIQQKTTDLDDNTVAKEYIQTKSKSPVTPSSRPAKDLNALQPSPCKPKDLSNIFAPLPQPTPAFSTPKKSLTKQMLIRSRTEPSLLSSPTSSPSSRSRISASLSLPNLEATPDRSNSERHNSPPSTSISASPAPFRTYSQSRSFLLALPDVGASPSFPFQQNSYADLRTRWGVESSEDDPTHAPGITNDLLSITELRSKGESRRFMDEVGYLFEGLQESDLAIGVRRSSAAEIVMKMCDPEFSRRAKATDFIGRAWDAQRSAGAGDGDKLLDIYLLFFVALVSRDRRDIDHLAGRDGFYSTLIRLMRQAQADDGLSMANSLGSKPEIAVLSRVKNMFVSKSNALVGYSTLSMRLLASYALSHVSSQTYPPQLIPAVLDSLMEVCATITLTGNSPITIKGSGLVDIEHIEHCLHILDAFLNGFDSRSFQNYDLATRKEALCSNLTSISILSRVVQEGSIQYNSVCRCMEMTLRILIALSHMGVEWCSILAGDDRLLSFLVRQISQASLIEVKAEVSEDNMPKATGETTMDHRSLSLALLSNIVLSVERTKDYLRAVSMNPSCSFGPSCSNSCQCPQQVNAIEYLSNVFGEFQHKTESLDAEDLEFFRCHLAALLCLLAAGNPENENTVRDSLVGVYDTFSHSVELFLGFYKTAQGPGEAIHNDSQSQIAEACTRICP